jgi:hypothetical protein
LFDIFQKIKYVNPYQKSISVLISLGCGWAQSSFPSDLKIALRENKGSAAKDCRIAQRNSLRLLCLHLKEL